MSTVNVSSGISYVITNVKAGTAMDLSAYDNRSIIGWPEHGHLNQQWKMNWTGNSWTFQAGSTGEYLSIDGEPKDGTGVIASPSPFGWHIWRDDKDNGTYRVFVPNTHQNLDLYGRGDSTPGNPITLWYTWPGIHQTWKFTQIAV